MTRAERRKGESLDRLLDAFTDDASRKLHAAVVTIVEARPAGVDALEAATGAAGALLSVLVHAVGAIIPAAAGEPIEEHAARVVGFIVDGLADSAPIFLGADPHGDNAL